MTPATAASGSSKAAKSSPEKMRPSSQPSKPKRTIPTADASSPTTIAPTIRRRTPSVNFHRR